MNVERWWKNGVLVRETVDGEERTENLGKKTGISSPMLDAKPLISGFTKRLKPCSGCGKSVKTNG